MPSITKTFSSTEKEIYQQWEDLEIFKAKSKSSNEKFFLPMPPPNITGKLHMGHAVFTTLQDIISRYQRSEGKDVLWLPGTDHAGLATHEKILSEINDRNIDLSQYHSFAKEWESIHQSEILDQLKILGSSCDWSRTRYTMDEKYQSAILEAMRICEKHNMIFIKDDQIYLDMTILAGRASTHIKNGDIQIIPDNESKSLINILDKIEPWCISRQIPWGYRIPLYRNNDNFCIAGDINEAISKIGPCHQIDDVLDTWFSSSLWCFATLGWPEKTDDMRYFPADLLETGYDILFPWCGRMIMMTLLCIDKLPFKTIYLHGIMRDKEGRKLSKSLGNGEDPRILIEKYGCDAIRFAIAENCTAGQDFHIADSSYDSAKRLGNKLWQSARFCDRFYTKNIIISNHGYDLELANHLFQMNNQFKILMDGYKFREAATLIRHSLHDIFCNQYIESIKGKIDDDSTRSTLSRALDFYIEKYSYFMPYRCWELKQHFMKKES